MRDEKEKGPGDGTASRGPRADARTTERGNDASRRACPTPSFSDAEALAKAGHQLIPLRPRDKAPRDKDWPRRAYALDELMEWARGGGNLGVRLRATDLVVDADPRNYPEGRDSLAELARDVGLDLDAVPHTITGGGGHHYWLRKPADFETLGKLPQYPGIDFKSRGFQVVAPGSVHPSGERYR
ncbi:MAG: transcriptional regulator, partial [Proteobacteria bacterium]